MSYFGLKLDYQVHPISAAAVATALDVMGDWQNNTNNTWELSIKRMPPANQTLPPKAAIAPGSEFANLADALACASRPRTLFVVLSWQLAVVGRRKHSGRRQFFHATTASVSVRHTCSLFLVYLACANVLLWTMMGVVLRHDNPSHIANGLGCRIAATYLDGPGLGLDWDWTGTD